MNLWWIRSVSHRNEVNLRFFGPKLYILYWMYDIAHMHKVKGFLSFLSVTNLLKKVDGFLGGEGINTTFFL